MVADTSGAKGNQAEFPKKILLAVAFDEKLTSMIQSAKLLCRETGAAIRLVHVCDPWTGYYLAGSTDLSYLSNRPNYQTAIQHENIRIAEDRLKNLVHLFDQQGNIEYQALVGNVSEELTRDAQENEADLILIGAHYREQGQVHASFSTATEIINASKIPVMVINDEQALVSKWPKHRIVVADSLREEGERALRVATKLAIILGGADLRHVHAIDSDELKKSVASQLSVASAKSADSKAVKDTSATMSSVRQLIDSTIGDVQSKLQNHVLKVFGQPDLLRGEYSKDISIGKVPVQIKYAANAHAADIIVFGHHEMYHRLPHAVGRVPLKDMINQRRTVVVVP